MSIVLDTILIISLIILMVIGRVEASVGTIFIVSMFITILAILVSLHITLKREKAIQDYEDFHDPQEYRHFD